jgi:RNA polymerase subunit RPABC4/transcription elongation factor Spt4
MIQEKPLDLRSEELMGTEREYNLKCKVKVINQTYIEEADGKQHETKSVILIPDVENTEAMMFLSAWLPEVSRICLDCGFDMLRIQETKCTKCGSEKLHTGWSEVPAFITSPVNSPSRLAVLRKNNYCNEHHLFVMSSGVEDELILMDGRTVYVKTFEGTKDEICDMAPSLNRTAKV